MELIHPEKQSELAEALKYEERPSNNLMHCDRVRCADLIMFIIEKYNLPSEVFFTAIYLFDICINRFTLDDITKSICSSLACVLIAIEAISPEIVIGRDQLIRDSNVPINDTNIIKMKPRIIAKKNEKAVTVTALDYLKLFHSLFLSAATTLEYDLQFATLVNLEELTLCLEILKCESRCAMLRSSELAFVIISKQFESRFKDADISPQLAKFKEFTEVLQGLEILNFTTESFSKCEDYICLAIFEFNKSIQPERQYPRWMISPPIKRNKSHKKPSARRKSYLDAIKELSFDDSLLDVSLTIMDRPIDESTDES